MNKNKKYRNQFYYIGLIIVHTILLFFVFKKQKDRQTILLTFLSIAGLAFYFEYPLYILKAYKYKTKILKNKEQDNSLGSVLSQAILVPSAAIFISTFQFGWKIKLLFTMYFVLIERSFIKMKFFKNNWWHTTYTAFSIFCYFFISDGWYNSLKEGNKIILKMTLYNIFHVIYMMFLFLLSLTKRFRYQPTFYTTQPWYLHYAFVKLYLVVETVITFSLLEQKKKWVKILPILIIVVIDSFFKKVKLLKVKGSYWINVFPARVVAHLLLFLLKKWIDKYEIANKKLREKVFYFN